MKKKVYCERNSKQANSGFTFLAVYKSARQDFLYRVIYRPEKYFPVGIFTLMPWNRYQKTRLALERKKLEEEFPRDDIKWIDPTEETKVELRILTNRGNKYVLRVHIPLDFPHSVPVMVVFESPQPMPAWDNDFDNHTLNRKDGLLNICHHYQEHWSPNRSRLVKVFKKGRHWLEAYESSIETGRPINFYLDYAVDIVPSNIPLAVNACAPQ